MLLTACCCCWFTLGFAINRTTSNERKPGCCVLMQELRLPEGGHPHGRSPGMGGPGKHGAPPPASSSLSHDGFDLLAKLLEQPLGVHKGGAVHGAGGVGGDPAGASASTPRKTPAKKRGVLSLLPWCCCVCAFCSCIGSLIILLLFCFVFFFLLLLC